MQQSRLTAFLALMLAGAALWSIAVPAAGQQTYAQTYPPGIGFNPAVNYTMANFAQSPNVRKFVDSLPGLGYANRNNLNQYIPVAVPNTTMYPGSDYYDLTLRQFTMKMHTDLPATTLRGYAQMAGTAPGQSADPNIGGAFQYLGAAIIARAYDPAQPAGVNGNGKPVRVLFRNELPTGAAGNLFVPVDMTLMGAGMGPTAGTNFTQNRATIPHLHGGHTPWISDGTPHQWVTPKNETLATTAVYQRGPSLVNVPDMVGAGKSIATPAANDGMATLYWTNQQSGGLMFYHDHAWGTTRLNVYAGMAAPYLLVSQVEDDLIDGTNVSGVFGTGTPAKILPDQAGLDNGTGLYRYGIPLVIQDKAFVCDASTPPGTGYPAGTAPTPPTLTTDPLWGTYVGTTGGNLWFPHEYLPIENIFDPSGQTPTGRWDYAPFMIPPMPPVNLTLPSPTCVPESFGDTMVVNGTAFPYLTLPPDVVRFRILSIGNDRVLNLQVYQVDPNNPTEVKMVDAAPNAAYPTWPRDGREGGVPDPTTHGPPWIMVGNESGFLAQLNVIPQQPVDFEYVIQNIPTLGVTSRCLTMFPAQRADVLLDLSQYKDGNVLMVYNDAPAPFPGHWPVNDYYTGCPDQTATGGPVPVQPGFGPNTRTVMQIRIKGTKTTSFDFSSTATPGFDRKSPNPGGSPPNLGTEGPSLQALRAMLPAAFAKGNNKPLVPQTAYNAAFPGFASSDIYMQSVDTTFNITGAAGAVTRVKTTMPGNNYTLAPNVVIVGGGGTGTAGTAGLNPCGMVSLLTSGTGYTTVPTVTVGPPGAGGVQATAVATISGGLVTAITLDEPGSNYSTTVAPTVTITGGGGTGATASAMVATANTVGSITLTSGGSGYTRQPQVYLTNKPGVAGMGASAVALVAGALPMTSKNIMEGFDPDYGRMDIRMGSTPNPLTPNVGNGMVVGVARYIDPPTEVLNDGELTLWRITHIGVDSHALHFHLFDVQVVNRVDWTNVVKPPYAEEIGWRDTIRTNPLEDILVAFKPESPVVPFVVPKSNRLLDPTNAVNVNTNFLPVAPPAGVAAVAQVANVMTNFGWEYVFHCHMLGHEENDFMRPEVFNVLAPTAPSGLRLTGSAGNAPLSVTLNWTYAGTAPAFFAIQRSTSSNFGGAVSFQAPVGATSFTDSTNLIGRTRYYYRIAALNGGGQSAWAPSANLTTAAGPVPVAPTNLAAGTPTRTSVPLTWTNVGGTTGASVQWTTDPNFLTGIGTVAVNTANVAAYTRSGLLRNTTYYFRVAEKNAAGTGPYCAPVSAKTLP